MFELKFEREAMGVDSYSTDKSTYISNDFNIELHNKVQRISHIGVVGHYQNGVVENAINMRLEYP